MQKFDFIIVGAGMGGLSVANFLAKYNKKVLVLEKHNIPGGLVTSFARKSVHFDLGIHGLYELKEGQAIPQFLEYWGAPQIDTVPCRGDMNCYINGKKHVFRHGSIKADFIREFPENEADIEEIFQIMETINTEMFSGTEAPEPPYDMNLFQLIRFGMKSRSQKPMFMKYGNKDAKKILDQFSDSKELKSAIYLLGREDPFLKEYEGRSPMSREGMNRPSGGEGFCWTANVYSGILELNKGGA